MRHFKINQWRDLCSSRQRDQLDTPGAIVSAMLPDDEQLVRVFQKVYELGRKDQREDIRKELGL